MRKVKLPQVAEALATFVVAPQKVRVPTFPSLNVIRRHAEKKTLHGSVEESPHAHTHSCINKTACPRGASARTHTPTHTRHTQKENVTTRARIRAVTAGRTCRLNGCDIKTGKARSDENRAPSASPALPINVEITMS